jgi:hypothetical protein
MPCFVVLLTLHQTEQYVIIYKFMVNTILNCYELAVTADVKFMNLNLTSIFINTYITY